MNKILVALILFLPGALMAQGSLLDDIDTPKEAPPAREKVYETFLGNRIINGHSVETPSKRAFSYIIAHRFGYLNSGFESMFGIDQASVRMGLEYGIIDNLCLGFARNKGNTWDAFVKYRVLQQSKGSVQNGKKIHGMPVSLTLFASMAIDGRKKLYTDGRPDFFWQRLMYSYQIMIARKFGKHFSLQLMPSVVHRNIVETKNDPNTLFALGAGTRIRISNVVSLTGEYYYSFNQNSASGRRNSVGIGVDITTGGHVFQLHATNSQLMYEAGFIGNTRGDILNGDICLGFNVTRSLAVNKKPKKKRG